MLRWSGDKQGATGVNEVIEWRRWEARRIRAVATGGVPDWSSGAWGARGVNGRGAREASSVGRIERAQAPSVFSTILWTSLDLLH
jgi:hypothetical protein